MLWIAPHKTVQRGYVMANQPHSERRDSKVSTEERGQDRLIGFIGCVSAILLAWFCNDALRLSVEITCLVAVGTLIVVSLVGVIISDRRNQR